MVEYRVEAVGWDGHDLGASHLEDRLNDFASEGWEVVVILPTTAATSIRSLRAAVASADTSEFAVVLKRSTTTRTKR